jgi:hypothetical protein
LPSRGNARRPARRSGAIGKCEHEQALDERGEPLDLLERAADHVAVSQRIASGEDLTAAREQKQAMAQAKRTLAAATADATKKNPGYRAVSAIPRTDEGHPVAEVSLPKGDRLEVRLDSAR